MSNEKTVSFTPEALKAVLDGAIAEALAAAGVSPKAGKAPANTLVDGKTEGQLKLDVLVCKTFKKAGFGEVKPRQDVRTYNRWLSEGWRVRPGEKALKIRQFRLFHKSQVEFVGLPDKAEQRAEGETAVANAAQAATPTKPGIVARLKAKATSAAPAQSSLPV